ncbi:MAG TPA: hypothetical protein VKZ50_00435 [bacterium]|nr:hypothetical protein [bacterium]
MRTSPAPPLLAVDGTGIGAPVIDYLNAIGLRPFAVTLTTGKQQHYTNVPKADVVHGLLMLIQSGRFKIARELTLLPQFHREMSNFCASQTPRGKTSYARRLGTRRHGDVRRHRVLVR